MASSKMVYRQGRSDFTAGRKLFHNPYIVGSIAWESWRNGWLDASQGIGASGLQMQETN